MPNCLPYIVFTALTLLKSRGSECCCWWWGLQMITAKMMTMTIGTMPDGGRPLYSMIIVVKVTMIEWQLNDYDYDPAKHDDDDDTNEADADERPVNKAREHELDFCSNLRLYYTQRQIILTSSTLFCVPTCPILPTNSDLHSCTMLHNSFQSSKLRFLSIVQAEVLLRSTSIP